MLLSAACSAWSPVTRSSFCCRQPLPATLCFMHRWLFTIPAVISPLTAAWAGHPPCPLLFSFKTKQKPKQGIQRMFFLPTKEISGGSSKPLVSALGLAAMCSISHWLSLFTGKCAPTSQAAAGEQLDGQCWAETHSQSKGGVLFKRGILFFFWMNIEGELPDCVFLFLQGTAHGQSCCSYTLHPWTKRVWAEFYPTVSAAMRQGITLPGVMEKPLWSCWADAFLVPHLSKCSLQTNIFGLPFPLTFPCVSHC